MILRLLLVELMPDEACDIAVQHRLRECLQLHRPAKDEFGVRVPVVAAVRQGPQVRYVCLGQQFCVRDASAAVPCYAAACPARRSCVHGSFSTGAGRRRGHQVEPGEPAYVCTRR